MPLFGKIHSNYSFLTQQIKHQLLSILYPLQQLIDRWEIREQKVARQIVRLIPSACPFAREVKIFGKVVFRIPALCKLNPLYEQFMNLRFRALCFLSEHCKEDITPYCV
jgi:Mo-dependent nitrogenase C-terminus